MDTQVRTILPSDNIEIAAIIRNTLAEFGANRPGTVYFDASTDILSEVFQTSGSIYYVGLSQKTIIGGAGIFPSEGLPEDTCELVKMYLLPEARGKGIGKMLIEKCIGFAKDAGYKKIYLETMPELKKAMHVYEKCGFTYLPGPIGNTGHFGCDVWMIREL
ncbi:MAG: GNAT family N-acetyltransferase [Chitinophagaceae bacterium]|nr:GNAT family N-acetyltransferase [Chitinophagaceae bacterium]